MAEIFPNQFLLSSYDRWLVTILLLLSTSSKGGVWAQNGDGGGASGVEPGDIGGGSPGTGSENAGAQGSDTGSVKLSVGATVAIAVVVSLVVILGGTTAILFFLAKKRQWKIKEGLRKSATKVKSAVKAVTTPMTPKRMTFGGKSPVENQRRRIGGGGGGHTERTTVAATNPKKGLGIRAAASAMDDGIHRDKDRDLEKGVATVVAATQVTTTAPATRVVRDDGNGSGSDHEGDTESQNSKNKIITGTQQGERKSRKEKPRPPKVEIPTSSFEIDSPKTPIWKKVFGR
ncbi:uncharacterized protein PV06_07053 [Exophiala oligosperma]|uniref:Uncharacterized protein n=2 Tax=Chaetothyriales TaxID=34395 RepID=A0A0D2DEU3_9EURO|nr:uncharacterized protein PV06_07053 [Exophiala oligosperma]KAJ9634753.1 hypothetical protein H2204_006202 [Knufia peltigerae]KIW41503.1 hypothetical protein PV06_07053 [Exophiala oligosperma]